MPNGQVELALNPEELGRVKMSIASSDAAIVVSILAERPETLTLMRRNIDQLTAEFHALGYAQIEFNFAGGQSDKNRENNSDHHSDHRKPNDVAKRETTAPLHSISLVASDGLDLRL